MPETPDDTTPSPAIDQLLTVAESRLRELEPIAAEIAQLQNVIAVLKGAGTLSEVPNLAALLGTDAADVQAPPLRRGRRGTKRGRDGRAPQGANKQLIIETVMAHPGIRPVAIAELTGLKRTIVSSTVNRLKRQGELETRGDGLRVVAHPAAVNAA